MALTLRAQRIALAIVLVALAALVVIDTAAARPHSSPSLQGITLHGVSDKLFVQGAAVSLKLPSATGGDGHPNYAYTLTPNVSGIGLTFTASTRQLSGTPTAPSARASYTCTATEASDPDGAAEPASRAFTIGVRPQQPAGFTATAIVRGATLDWTAIDGVSGWQVQLNGGD